MTTSTAPQPLTFQRRDGWTPGVNPPVDNRTGPTFKTLPEYFQPLWDGYKRAELRRVDPDKPIEVGTMVALCEWRPEQRETTSSFGDRAERELVVRGHYTGRAIMVRVTHVLDADDLRYLIGFAGEAQVFSFDVAYRIDA